MITRTVHKVNFYDTDAMAVVHHANYIRWFEIGRVEFLREAGITLGELMDAGYVFPITDVKAKYVSPGKFDDELIIETRPKALTKVKMVFNYRILRKDVVDGKEVETLLVEGSTQNVFTKEETGVITRLPEVFYEKLKKALED